ncbi:MAG: hypothetical protein KF713_18490 [Turneriella sp.]|nr:hypothetical protein [Turneriella sp.]
MKKIHILFVLAITSLGPVSADAPGKHEGFFANLMLGGGLGGYTYTSGTTKETGTGGTFQYGGKLGYALSGNFALFGALDGWSLSNPSVTLTTGSSTQSGTAQNATYSVFMFGGGIGFFTDSRFFILGTIGLASGKATQNNISVSSDYGFGANINIGQEWEIAKDFGIGVALVGHYSSVKYPITNSPSFTQFYVGVAVSASYN